MEDDDWRDVEEYVEGYESGLETENEVDDKSTPETHTLSPSPSPSQRPHNDEEIQWKKYVATLPLGQLPQVDACKTRHGIERHLQFLNIRPIRPENAIAYHFYQFYSRARGAPPVPEKRQCTISGCEHFVSHSTSSSSMELHAQQDHSDIWNALKTFRDKQTAEKARPSQPTISSSFQRAGTIELNSRQKARFLRSLTEWKAEDLVPMSYLEKPAFKKMISFIDARYKIPAITTFKKDLRVYKVELMQKLIDIVDRCDKVMFTADSWKSLKGESFFGATLHYVTEQFQLMTITIAMRHVKERQFSSHLKNIMEEIFQDWRLANKVLVGTTDSGANIKRAMEDMNIHGVKWTPCAAHTIQLCIQTATSRRGSESTEEGGRYPQVRIERVVEKCHDLAALLRRTLLIRKYVNQAQLDIHRAQDESGMTKCIQLAAKLDVPTRWNSQYFMVERILQLMPAIKQAEGLLLSSGDVENVKHSQVLARKMLSTEEECVAREYLVVLEPAVQFTIRVSAENTSTISQVYIAAWDMVDLWTRRNQGQDLINTEAGKKFRRYLVTEVQRRWSIHMIEDFHIIAMYLNPASRDHAFFERRVKRGRVTASFLEHGRNLVNEKLKEMLMAGYAFPRENKMTRFSSGEDELDEPETNEASEGPMSPLLRSERAITRETERYERHRPSVNRLRNVLESDPLEWWRRQRVYRFLPVLARQYLAVQASSVASERLFSDAGNLVTKRRAGLSSAMIADILFVRRAMRHMKRYEELKQ